MTIPALKTLLATLAVSVAVASPLSSPAQAFKDDQSPLTWGGELRIRDEYQNGAVTLDTKAPRHEQNLIRVRSRIWTTWTATPKLAFNSRLVAEPRYWTTPAATRSHFDQTGWEERYAFLDKLNLTWNTELAGEPLTATIGRQDISLGSRWLLLEGTPGDGSWTTYFDALRLRWDLRSQQSTLDLLLINQLANSGTRFGSIGSSDGYAAMENDEKGLVLFLHNASQPNTQFDGYYILKKNTARAATGNNATLSTLGGRWAGNSGDNWEYSIEGALQWGWKEDQLVGLPDRIDPRRDLQAFGCTGRLTYRSDDPLRQRLSLTAEYLSGDDPSTEDQDEMFDALWGRWPQYSDISVYARVMETGAGAQAANHFRIGPEWKLSPSDRSSITLSYQVSLALESTPTRALNHDLFGGGHLRGNIGRLTIAHRFTENVRARFQAEAFRQGDFYANQDTLSFLRLELIRNF